MHARHQTSIHKMTCLVLRTQSTFWIALSCPAVGLLAPSPLVPAATGAMQILTMVLLSLFLPLSHGSAPLNPLSLSPSLALPSIDGLFFLSRHAAPREYIGNVSSPCPAARCVSVLVRSRNIKCQSDISPVAQKTPQVISVLQRYRSL